jgi:hypothetical protein
MINLYFAIYLGHRNISRHSFSISNSNFTFGEFENDSDRNSMFNDNSETLKSRGLLVMTLEKLLFG